MTEPPGIPEEHPLHYVDCVIALENGTQRGLTLKEIIQRELMNRVVSYGMNLQETSQKLRELVQKIDDANVQNNGRGSLKVRNTGEYDHFINNLTQHYLPSQVERTREYTNQSKGSGGYPIGEPFGYDGRLQAFVQIVRDFFRNKALIYDQEK